MPLTMKPSFIRLTFVLLCVIAGVSYAANPSDRAFEKDCQDTCAPTKCENMIVAHQCYTNCKGSIAEACMKSYSKSTLTIPHKLNTSNPGKLTEFKQLFKIHNHELNNTDFDLAEVNSDPLTVIAQKASAVNEGQGGILVEDTSLDIEGEDVGVNIRWLLSNLEQFEGKRATWSVMLAFREGDVIFVSNGVLEGTIVTKRGSEGFGFDPYFLPKGADKTLAENKPISLNARAFAVNALMNKEFIAILPAIDNWEGSWQTDHD